jgi:hypothetical protein
VCAGQQVDAAGKEFVKVKARTIWILAVLVMAAAAGLLVGSSLFWFRDFAPEKGLREAEDVAVKTRVGQFGVHKGDAFFYVVEVWYDPNRVAEIDRSNLGKSVHLEPFEVRDTKESEFDLPDSGNRVYRREYRIQLLDGKVDYMYKFPTLTLRYRLKDSSGFLNKPVTPEAVYVSSRLPSNVSGLQLRPLKGKIQVASDQYFTWILFAAGGLLALLAVIDLAWRAVPQWKQGRRERRTVEGLEILSEAYRALHANFSNGVEPKSLLHQVDHILRVALARKGSLDWLDGADVNDVASDIKPAVASLFEKCEKAYTRESVDQNDKEEAVAQLEHILKFYFGRKEVEAWRN